MVAFSLFTIAYYIQTYIVYYKNLKEKTYEEEIPKLERAYKAIVTMTILTILIGFMMYFSSQYADKKQNWSTLKFIFGHVKCDSLKKIQKS
jgi:formate hydrogenlyase subunit 3/multisubunit Na+/H+ antiporter MnhD subunit